MSLNASLLSSDRSDWETPQWLFERFDAIFHFQLDAAASANNAECGRYFDEINSAFHQPWTPEPVWLNPPYGAGVIDRFVRRAQYESERNGATVVCLIPARTATKWLAVIWQHARVIVFLRGRLKFVGADSSAPFPSALAIFSPEPVLPRYPELLDTVADLGQAVDRQTLRARRPPPVERGFPPAADHDRG
jgi:phage N-6-adenine-methyltransferase